MLMSTGHHGARTGQTGRPQRNQRTHPAAALGTRADQAVGMPGWLSDARAKAAATWCCPSINLQANKEHAASRTHRE